MDAQNSTEFLERVGMVDELQVGFNPAAYPIIARHFFGVEPLCSIGEVAAEADAIPPADLRAIVEEAITQHIDKAVLNTTMVAERSEREIVRAWAKQLEARP